VFGSQAKRRSRLLGIDLAKVVSVQNYIRVCYRDLDICRSCREYSSREPCISYITGRKRTYHSVCYMNGSDPHAPLCKRWNFAKAPLPIHCVRFYDQIRSGWESWCFTSNGRRRHDVCRRCKHYQKSKSIMVRWDDNPANRVKTSRAFCKLTPIEFAAVHTLEHWDVADAPVPEGCPFRLEHLANVACETGKALRSPYRKKARKKDKSGGSRDGA